jgi:hypothetical protein
MTESTGTGAANDLSNVQRALTLLNAYREDLVVRAQENEAYQQALQALTAFDNEEEFAAEVGRVVQGLVILSSVLVEDLADQSSTTPETILRAYVQRTQESIAQLEGE